MSALIFLAVAAAIIATTLSERKILRIISASAIIATVGVGCFLRGLSQYYERGFVAASVVSLAKQSPGDVNESLIEAAEDFRRDFRRETIFESGSGSALWNAIRENEQQNKKKSNKSEMATPRKPSD